MPSLAKTGRLFADLDCGLCITARFCFSPLSCFSRVSWDHAPHVKQNAPAKRERYWVANSHACFKKTSLKTSKAYFTTAPVNGYNGKAKTIEHQCFYALRLCKCKPAPSYSFSSSQSCESPCIWDAFMRSIFTPFFKQFLPTRQPHLWRINKWFLLIQHKTTLKWQELTIFGVFIQCANNALSL